MSDFNKLANLAHRAYEDDLDGIEITDEEVILHFYHPEDTVGWDEDEPVMEEALDAAIRLKADGTWEVEG